MPIIKAKQKKDYVEIPNKSARDKDLSLEAKGLLCVLLSMDDDWKVYKKQVAEYSTNKYHSTNTAFEELMGKGYIIDLGRHRDDKGFFRENLYEVHQFPQPNRDFPDLDNPDVDNQYLRSNTPYSRITENHKKSLISNEESYDSSEDEPKDMFGEPLSSTSKPKSKKPKKDIPRAHGAYAPIIDFFCVEYWPDYNFMGARDGKQVKEIISQIEKLLVRHERDSSPESVVEFFKTVVQNAPAFYQKKSLPVINSKFSEIIEEIKKQRNGQTTKKRSSYLTADL